VDLSVVTLILTSATRHATAMAPRLVDAGLSLLTGLAVIAVSWRMLTSILSGKDVRGMLADVLIPGVTIGVIAYLIRDLDQLSFSFLAGIDWIANTLTETPAGSSPLDAALGAQAKLALAVWEAISADSPGWWEWLTNTSGGIGTLVMRLLTVAVMALVMAITVGMFIMSQVLAGVAIALGPIFLPFLVLKQLSFIANGWIKFLFTAGTMKIIGLTMISFGAAMAGDLNTLAANVVADKAAELNFSAAVAMLAVSCVMLMLSLQIPSIASGLVSGSIGAAFDTSPVTGAASGAVKAARASKTVADRISKS